jgi:hypothetical protein
VGTKFGGNPEEAVGEARFVGATPDASHVVLNSKIGLTEKSPVPSGGLYEWSADLPAAERLQLVSVLPENEGGEAVLGGIFFGGHVKGGNHEISRHAISDDGSRVIFTASAPGQSHGHLYMRDVTRDETIRLDTAEGGSTVSQTEAFYQDASSDGSRVFFTSLAPLTKDAGGNEQNAREDLYECTMVEIEEGGRERLKCDLSDLTPVSGPSGAGEAAGVQGDVLGASENDGGYVYFVANGVQAQGASPGNCEGSEAGGKCNLYVRRDGVTSFIATLSSDDYPDWNPAGVLNKLTSRVSPDGVWLTFMSDRSLTGYDNDDAKSGMPDEEVYLYNAQSGRLVCASCNPTGARPDGVEYSLDERLVGGDRVWHEHQWLAANIPGWTPYELGEALYQSRYLSDSGRLFFNSSDALVPQDTNGNEDVYEYEPVGAGPTGTGCSESSATFSAPSDGCVGLISSGLAYGESAFLDASSDGSDVFFLTSEKLVPEDLGAGIDIYDAHECNTSSPCAPVPAPPVPECISASACRLAAMSQPPIYGPPSSSTFSGAGNITRPEIKPTVKAKSLTRAEKLSRALKQCKKMSRKKRVGCERQAHKRYGKVKTAVKPKSSKKTKVM